MALLDLDQVVAVHDAIIERLGGIPGFASGGKGGVESALMRIQMHQAYGTLVDVFGIAALYATALARGHVFNDGNKRTALSCALDYLLSENILIPTSPDLEDAVVYLAEGALEESEFAEYLNYLWMKAGQPPAPIEASKTESGA